MAEPQARPQDGDGVSIYPEWGKDGTNEAAPTASEKDDGYAVGVKNISSSKINWLRNRVQQWAKWFRQKALHLYDLCDTTIDHVSVDGKPPTASGLSTASTYSEFWIDGSRVELKATNFTVNASKDTYIGVDDSGATEQNEVANGAGEPSPSAGFVHVWKLVSDSSDITATSTLLPTGPSIGAHDVGISGSETWTPFEDGKVRTFRTHVRSYDYQNNTVEESMTARGYTAGTSMTDFFDFGAALPSNEVWFIEVALHMTETSDRTKVYSQKETIVCRSNGFSNAAHHAGINTTGGTPNWQILSAATIKLQVQSHTSSGCEWFASIKRRRLTVS